ncbi:myosin-7B-like [Elysia marginata]|uniref:Myosin-7B-like n=1 Tax=Elysia marginata TaxID=1093978 RepID=A0AAV4ET87_9GAST|nr:myosin-7B-like [Elysia marginata]
MEVRDRDKQLERAYEKHEDVLKELEASKNKISELEKKIEDLKLQVRYELMKNENIERGLETIPRLKEEISERDAKITSIEKELEERTALLNASRKAAREYKEKIRTLERNDEEVYALRDELEFCKNEINTLKRLMSSKDTIVLHKCHALDQAKNTVESLKSHTGSESERSGLRRIQQCLEQLKQLHVTSLAEEHRGPGAVSWAKDRQTPHNIYVQSRPRSAAGERGIDVNHHPYSNSKDADHTDANDNDHHDGQNNNNSNINTAPHSNGHSSTYIFLERFLQDTESPDSRKGRITPQQHHSQQQQPQQQQHRWASTPPGTSKMRGRGSAGVGGRRVSSGAGVQRSASFHHLDQLNLPHNNSSQSKVAARSHTAQTRKNSPYSHSTSPNGRANLGSANLISPRISARTPQVSTSVSTHGLHGQAGGAPRGSTGNLYTSEIGHRPGSRYQPSLDYALGVSTDEEFTTDTSFSGQNYSKTQQHQQRAKSAGSTLANGRDNYQHQPYSNTGSDSESVSCAQSQHEADDPFGPRLSSRQIALLSAMSGQQKDAILCDAIQIGDRASITVNQKPPRYGRKKPKPVTYTGIVKYMGNLDKESYDARIYVGLRLDAPLGESDGTFKGKRYMFTPPDHARFFKIRDLDSVLDVSSGMYVTTAKLILRHQEIHLKYQQEQQQLQLNGDEDIYDYEVSTESPANAMNGNSNPTTTTVIRATVAS